MCIRDSNADMLTAEFKRVVQVTASDPA